MTALEASALNEAEDQSNVLPGRSYLFVDYGHSGCAATLYDVVEGAYRLVGRGEGLNTAGPPWFDLSYGLQQAIGQIAEATGRQLLSLQGQLIRPMRGDGSGVDYFGATVSLGQPMKVIVAGLLESASIASARKALQAVYAREAACLSLDDGRGRPGQVETILVHQPDAIFLVGGTDGGADKQVRELLATIAIALELQVEGDRPAVIYGGNAQLRATVLEQLSELTDVHLVDNVRPAYETEDIGHAVAMLAQVTYTQMVERQPGSGVLADWCNTTPLSSAHAFGGIAEYLAAAGQGRVIGLDVGSGQVTLASAVSGQVEMLVRTDLGLGGPLRNLLAAGADGDASSPLAGESLEGPLVDYILDKSAHPWSLPMTSEAAKFELSLAARIIGRIAAEAAKAWSWPAGGYAPPCHTLLLCGRVFANAGRADAALSAALAGLRPQGVFKVVADGFGILPAMGLLAAEDPAMVVQILGGPDLPVWAWVIAPTGRFRQGGPLVSIAMRSASGKSRQFEVQGGKLEILPLPGVERFEVEIKPAAGVDIGAGAGKSRQLTMQSAIIGLAIDGRERRPRD